MGLTINVSGQERHNRYWPGIRRNRWGDLRTMYTESVRSHMELSGEKKVSPQALKKIKNRIREHIRQERRRQVLSYVFAGGITLLIIVFLVILF